MSVVDTNLLVHATSPASSDHDRAFAGFMRLTVPAEVAIPRQILREYLSVMTGRGDAGTRLSHAEEMKAVEVLQRMFRFLEDSPRVWTEFMRLAGLVAFAGKQVHDTDIVATMLAYGETRLLTFNVKNYRRFEPLIEVVAP